MLLLLASCSTAPAPDSAAAPGAATPDPARPLPSPLPDVVARVNGQEIRIRQILPLAKAALDKVSAESEREKRKPQAVREALDKYVDRELLLQEALARGIAPDTRDVDWSYDQLRREHVAEEAWAAFLAEQGLDPQSIKSELRIQHTVAALLAREVQGSPVPEAETRAPSRRTRRASAPGAAEPRLRGRAGRGGDNKAVEIQAALVARLRARAKIEIYL